MHDAVSTVARSLSYQVNGREMLLKITGIDGLVRDPKSCGNGAQTRTRRVSTRKELTSSYELIFRTGGEVEEVQQIQKDNSLVK